jgi:hypothetical protein
MTSPRRFVVECGMDVKRTSWKCAAPLLAAAIAMWLGPATATRAEEVFIPADRDNTLIENPSGARSNGAGPAVFAGRTGQSSNSIRRALLVFDLAAAIPAGARIESAVLELELTPSNDEPAAASLHRVLGDWGEGTSSSGGGSGARATLDDATWIHAFFDSDFWASPGGDFDESASAQIEVGSAGTYQWGSTPEMVADVQSWLDDPRGNHGWILIGEEEAAFTAKRFASRESPDPPSRPRLVVEFSLTCAGAGLTGSAWGLCHAYCEALDCAGDAPHASERACERIAKNFARRAGGALLPCER